MVSNMFARDVGHDKAGSQWQRKCVCLYLFCFEHALAGWPLNPVYALPTPLSGQWIYLKC